MTGESLVAERDCAAFFVFEIFTLETPLGLVSVDRRAGWVLSFSRLILLSDCVVVLELRGSDTNRVEPEGRSSEADLVASIKARTLFFLGLAMVGERDGDCDWVGAEDGKATASICSDSFGFFFLVDGGGDAELGSDDCEGDDVLSLCKGAAAADTAVSFLLCFFDCVCMDLLPLVGDLVKASAS